MIRAQTGQEIMGTRRQVLKMAAGAPMAAAYAAGERIDCQSHLFSEEFLRLLEKRKESPYVVREGADRYVIVGEWRRRILPKHTDVAAKLADMDRAGIAKAAISINDPGPELFGKDSPAMAALLNDFIAATVKAHPDRFFGLAALPFDRPESMLKEFDRATSRLGMKGILLYSNLNGRFPDEEPFRPLFAEAERRGVPVLLHPAYPVTYAATKGYEMAAGLGLMFDTTIALCRLILSGVIDRHPKLKLVCPHVGGALPYLIGRVDHQTMVLKRGADHIRKAPSEYLKSIWFDTVTPIGLAIRYALDFAGPDKLLYSSDHPWVDPQLIVGQVESQKLAEGTKRKLYTENAKALFGI
jgi:predicted TIM-barrel fold metal-dependent hydrolase